MKSLYQIGCILFFVPVLAYLMVSVLFLCGGKMRGWIFPASFVLVSLITMTRSHGFNRKTIFCCILVPLVVIAVSMLISHTVWDYSYDGMAYHQTVIYAMMHGWNPVYARCPIDDIWVNHYAKGMETMAALIATTCQSIESGKAINFIMLSATFCLVSDELFHFLPGARRRKVFGYVLLAVLSPVVIAQIFSYYIDFSMYLFVLIILSQIHRHCRIGGWQPLALMAVILALSISVKFNMAFWISLELLIYCGWLVYRKQWRSVKRGVVLSVIGALVGMFVFSYNPYMTNLHDGHHLLYPLMGEGKIDIMTGNTPEVLKRDRLSAVMISLLSRPGSKTDTWRYIPTKHSLEATMQYDTRLGGFGFLFIEILLFGLFIVFFVRQRTKPYKVLLLILGVLFLSLLLLPSGWWARYVPFFYLFPIAILFYVEKYGIQYRKLRIIWVVMLTMNAGISLRYVTSLVRFSNNHMRYCLELLDASAPVRINLQKNPGFKYKLQEHGIPYLLDDTASYRLHIVPEVFVVKTDLQSDKMAFRSPLK